MTIGIGVICSESKHHPDHLILASDALGSFGDAYSTMGHHKLFLHPESKVYAVGADDLEHCGDVVQKIVNGVAGLSQRTFGLIHDVIARAVWAHRSARFKYDVLPEFDIEPSDHWRKDAEKKGLLNKLDKRWQRFETNCLLIVSTFDENGIAAQFLVEPNGKVQSVMLPGFIAIGSGQDNALFWLGYRDQNGGMGVRQSAYHVYEAKRMAEQSPHVGKGDVDLLVASNDRFFLLNKSNPAPQDSPVSLPELEEMWRKFGPSETTDLERKE